MNQSGSGPAPDPVAKGRPGVGAVLVDKLNEAGDRRGKSRDIRPLRRLLPYLWKHRAEGFLAAVFLLFSTGATLGLTGATKLLVDNGFAEGAPPAELNRWFFLLGAVAVALALATALRYFYVTKLGERIVADLREGLYAHILTLDPAFFMRMRTGEVLSRMTTDIQLVESLVSTSISVALRNVLGLVGALILMVFVSPTLTGLVLLLLPVVLAPMFLFGRVVRKLTVKTQDKFAEAVGFAGESLDALETVQSFGREESASRRFSGAVENAFVASLQRVRARSVMTAMVITLIFGGITVILWLGAQAVQSDAMTPGTLVMFVFLSVMAASSVGSLGETWGDVQKAAGAMERIDELMGATPSIAPPVDPIALPTPPIGSVSFEDVVFHYPGRADLPALNGFTMTVRPGETIALVGPSGAGKTTVFRLLLRFYDPESGTVKVDGVDLRRADPRQIRQRMATVAQEASLFSGSAAENILFGREGASPDAVREAAVEAQALSFIEDLPEGFDTPLGERARALSGGQRQRMAIARALIRNAPILLLDEATSALDAENERLVQQALERAMTGRTTIVIAHRLATVLRADRIVVLDDGKVVEEGTHAELVAKGGLYARLAELQFDGG